MVAVAGGACLAGLAAWLRCHLKGTGVWRDRPRGPLKGVRVLDLTTGLAGPFASKILADMGAEVVRVDLAGRADALRQLGPAPLEGMSGAYVTTNTNKRSLALDLSKGGLEVLERLLPRVDIFLEDFEEGEATRLGLGYEAVRALKPDVVYASVSQEAPGPLLQALAGLCHEEADGDGPRLVQSALVEKLAALTVAQAVVAALVARDRGAGGQKVEVSALGSLLQFLWPDSYSGHTWQVPCSEGEPCPHVFNHLFALRDGKVLRGNLALGVTNEAEWRALCRALQRPDLCKDERFETAIDRAENVTEWREEVQRALNGLSADEALTALAEENVPHALTNAHDTIMSDAQATNCELFVRIRHSFLGVYQQPQFPCEFGENGACGAARCPPPLPGEHSGQILRESGFDRRRAKELFATGAVKDAAASATGASGLQKRLMRLFQGFQRFDKSDSFAESGYPLIKSTEATAVSLMRTEGPFAGLQVLEVGTGMEVSATGAVMADQGASVTKVEFTEMLDSARGLGPSPVEHMSAVHMATNRGKRSLVLDAQRPEAFQVLESLVLTTDVLIIGIPLEKAAELGLSYWELQHKRKGLIYISLMGYNSRGPRFWDPGHDVLVQALAGGPSACVGEDGRQRVVRTALADKVTAMFAALSLSAACRMMLRGFPQQVELDKYGCTVYFNFPDLFANSVWTKQRRSEAALGAHQRLVACSDSSGRCCVSAASDDDFQKLCGALGLLQEESHATLQGRLRNAAALATSFDEAMRSKSTEWLLAACEHLGVPHAPVLSPEEALKEPRIAEHVEESAHPVLGSFRLPRHAARFSETPARGRSPAPAPGEGCAAALAAAGYGEEDIARMMEDKVVAQPATLEAQESRGWLQAQAQDAGLLQCLGLQGEEAEELPPRSPLSPPAPMAATAAGGCETAALLAVRTGPVAFAF